jgi:hypothetical protein
MGGVEDGRINSKKTNEQIRLNHTVWEGCASWRTIEKLERQNWIREWKKAAGRRTEGGKMK